MKKIVGLGACVVDTLIKCESYPTEDTKNKAQEIKTACGGPVANALAVAVKLGESASLLNPLADDEGGRFIKRAFVARGVDVSACKSIANATSFNSYILLSQATGSRTCVFDRGTVEDDPKNIDLSAIEGASVLHLDGNYLNCAIEAAKYAKKVGVKVSLDAGGAYPNIEKLLELTDILIPSEEFALSVTGETTAEKAMLKLKEKYNPEILVITQGKKGGIYYQDGIKNYDSFNVKCVDSNGAGDTFHGAFLAYMLKGNDLKTCCKMASATSAVKCTCFGLDDENFNVSNVEKLASTQK